MTCIAGLVHGGNVYIGGDSAGVGGWTVTGRSDAKVFRNGPFLVGFTSSFRMGQLLRWVLVPPVQPAEMDTFGYMVTDFINAVRACLRDGGFAKKEAEAESGGDFLVGYRGRLFHIGSDYQVGEMIDGYMAVGSGADHALGAFHASQGLPPLARVRMALEAAEHHTMGVRGPFVIEVLEPVPARLTHITQPLNVEPAPATNGHRSLDAVTKEA